VYIKSITLLLRVGVAVGVGWAGVAGQVDFYRQQHIL
jgi:hypothetical protein